MTTENNQTLSGNATRSEKVFQTHSAKMSERANKNPDIIFWKAYELDSDSYLSHCGKWKITPPDGYTNGPDGERYTLFYRCERVSNYIQSCPIGFSHLKAAKEYAERKTTEIYSFIDSEILRNRVEAEKGKQQMNRAIKATNDQWRKYVQEMLSSIRKISTDVENAKEILRLFSESGSTWMGHSSIELIKSIKERLELVCLQAEEEFKTGEAPKIREEE
tara:strand:- start:6490 stop:7146 length:657 start_codon:yes stop_codon:yes gene_type:complete